MYQLGWYEPELRAMWRERVKDLGNRKKKKI